MIKPISHILRTLVMLLLSTVAVSVSAVCPNGSYDSQLWNEDGRESGSLWSDEMEMVPECAIVEGVKEIGKQNNSQIHKGSDKGKMTVSSEDVNGTYPYRSEIEDTDTEKSAPSVVVSNPLNERFSVKSLILPGGLIAAGVIGMETGLFKGRDDNEVEVQPKVAVDFEDVAQYIPAAAYLTLGFIPGIEHRHSFLQRSMAAVTAYGMMFLITKPVKHWIHERRPDWSSDDSFPSGHAATSFTGAELMRLEYGTGIGLGAYALATTVAVLRITHNRHWFNDIVAGAGVGILCARASYWLLPLERKLFGIKDPKVGVAAFPICNPQSRQFALGCCINF